MYWLMMGCFGNVAGVVIAMTKAPQVPVARLIGKSPEYTLNYIKYYEKKGRQNQMTVTVVGAVVCTGCLIYGFYKGEAAFDKYMEDSCNSMFVGF